MELPALDHSCAYLTPTLFTLMVRFKKRGNGSTASSTMGSSRAMRRTALYSCQHFRSRIGNPFRSSSCVNTEWQKT